MNVCEKGEVAVNKKLTEAEDEKEGEEDTGKEVETAAEDEGGE